MKLEGEAGMARASGGKAAALNKALQGMFKSLQSRPLPGSIRSVVDQLEAPPNPLRKSG